MLAKVGCVSENGKEGFTALHPQEGVECTLNPRPSKGPLKTLGGSKPSISVGNNKKYIIIYV